MPFGAISGLRRDMLLDVARHFRPRLLVVDNVPGGLKGELIPALRYLKSISCRLVLGLRDVVDEPEVVRRAWARDGSYELLERLYDRILVYGERKIFDLPSEYGFSAEAAAKTHFVGYLGREGVTRTREEIRSSLGVGSRRLALVMAGGGGDGYELLRAASDAAELQRNGSSFEWLLLGGPLLPDDQRRRLLEHIRGRSVGYCDFVDDVASYVNAADVVVSRAGMSSLAEIAALRKAAVLVPMPDSHQEANAAVFKQREAAIVLAQHDLTPEKLAAEVLGLLNDEARRARHTLPSKQRSAG